MAAQTSRKAAAALALTLLAVAGCTRHAEQDSGGPQVDVLGSMLARALMAHTLELWHQCAGDSLTITRGDRPPDVFLLAQPSVVDGVDVTHGEASDTPGYVSQRAIMVTDDLIVDIRITGHDVDAGKAVQLAKTIGGRNAL